MFTQPSPYSLAEYLQQAEVLHTPSLVRAFEYVQRIDFLLTDHEEVALLDIPLSIGYGQMNSQPYTVAFMLELLQPQAGQRVLEVGAGSGWTTGLLAAAVGEGGKVIGVERIPELVQFGRRNLEPYDFSWARIEQATTELGWPQGAPFDRILVSAATSGRIPHELVDQLAPDGILVVPVDETIYRFARGDKIRAEAFDGFSFVPLIREGYDD